jgi:hypothetical protein
MLQGLIVATAFGICPANKLQKQEPAKKQAVLSVKYYRGFPPLFLKFFSQLTYFQIISEVIRVYDQLIVVNNNYSIFFNKQFKLRNFTINNKIKKR